MKLNVYTVLLHCHFVVIIQYVVNNSSDGGRFAPTGFSE